MEHLFFSILQDGTILGGSKCSNIESAKTMNEKNRYFILSGTHFLRVPNKIIASTHICSAGCFRPQRSWVLATRWHAFTSLLRSAFAIIATKYGSAGISSMKLIGIAVAGSSRKLKKKIPNEWNKGVVRNHISNSSTLFSMRSILRETNMHKVSPCYGNTVAAPLCIPSHQIGCN